MTQKHLFLSILLILSFFRLQSQQDSSVYRLLWEISGNKLSQPSYLFGSMHVRDEMAFRFPDSLFIYLDRCDVFANEIHLDSAMDKTIALFMDPDFYSNYLEESWALEEENQLEADSLLLSNEIAGDSLDLLAPSEIIIAPKVETEPFSEIIAGLFRKTKKKKPTYLDAYLMQIAKQQGKELQGLENIDEHMELLKTDFLLYGNRDFSNLFKEVSNYRTLLKVYEKGNIDVMLPYITEKEKKDLQLIGRNYIMLASMERIMQEKSLFAVVGAAHLPGEEGLVELLREKGYQLRPIARTEPTTDGAAWYDRAWTPSWNTYSDTLYRYEVQMPCTAQQFDQQGTRMAMGMDIGKGLIFLTTGVDLMPHKKDQDELQYNFFASQGYQILSQTDTIIRGEKVMDFYLFNAQEELNYYRCQVWEKNQLFYLLYAGAFDKEQLQSELVDAFLGSLKIDGPVSNAPALVESKAGAFSTTMPESYLYSLDEADNTYFYSSENPERMHHYRAYDENGQYYLLRYKDIPPTGYSYYDENRLVEALYQLAGLFEIYELTDTLSVEKDGYPGKSGRALLESGEELFLQTFLRNNRLYMLAGTAPEGQASNLPLFSDFSFLPLQHSPLAHEANYHSQGISAFFPAPANSLSNDDYYYEESYGVDSSSLKIGAIDSLSGLMYYLDWEILPDLMKIDSADVYLEDFLMSNFGYYNWEDSLIQYEPIAMEGIARAKDFVILSPYHHTLKKGRAFFQGRGLVKIWVSGSEESLAQAPVDDFLNSLHIEVSLPIWQSDASASKIDSILAYALSEDTTKHLVLTDVFYKYPLDEAEAQKVKHTLFDDMVWPGQGDFMGIKTQLFSSLSSRHPELLSLEELARLYQLYPTHWELKSNILYHISGLDTPDARSAYFQLASQESDSLYAYTLLSNLYYKSDSVYAAYLGGLVAWLQAGYYSTGILELMNYQLEYNASDPGLLQPYLDQIAEQGDALIQQWQQDEARDSSAANYHLETLFRLYALLKTPNEKSARQARRILDFNLSSPLSSKALPVLVYQLEKSDQNYVKQMLSDTAQFLPTVRALNAADALRLIPKKTIDQEQIALALLKENYGSEGWSDLRIQLVQKRTLLFRGQSYSVFVYTYSYDNHWDNSQYVAAVGMFPEDPYEVFLDEGYIHYYYDAYEPEQLDEVIDKMVEEMSAW